MMSVLRTNDVALYYTANVFLKTKNNLSFFADRNNTKKETRKIELKSFEDEDEDESVGTITGTIVDLLWLVQHQWRRYCC